MKSRRGFTLLELMIVIAVILIIAAIAIPGMKDAKMNADETSAVGSIRAINTAEVSYQAAYGGYANTLSNLGGEEPCTRSAETACLIDQSLAGGDKSGYKFVALGGIHQESGTRRMWWERRRMCSITRGDVCSARQRRV